ncbi:MAG: OPT family oligopeptide transporter [Planctomycetota bacterium]|jgi:uncharacterized oligopeptide transporter (OPT) family protein
MGPTDTGSPSAVPTSGNGVLEFTLRALILGVILSAVLCAANVYMGLMAGMTVNASIPAAVISMGILRGIMRRGTIRENNIVQTMASAGESLAAGIIFTIPGLILTGVWSHFHFWTVSLIALMGGTLGIMFMIPLRRTLIVDEVELKYPEGVACAKVLEAGDTGGKPLLFILAALVVGAVLGWFVSGMALLKAKLHWAFMAGKGAVGFGIKMSSALIGVGYIVGFNVALLVFSGGVLAFFVVIPIYMAAKGIPAGDDPWGAAMGLWNSHIRFMGVGAMVVGGLWSIWKMRNGIIKGIGEAFGGYGGKGGGGERPRTDRDMPMRSIVLIAIVMVIGIFAVYTVVTTSHVIEAKGGYSVHMQEKGLKGKLSTYALVPLMSGDEQWKTEGTVYEEFKRAYLVEVGQTEKEFTDKTKDAPIPPTVGASAGIITTANESLSGTITKVEEDTYTVTVLLKKVVQVPEPLVVDMKGKTPGQEVTIKTPFEEHKGVLLEVQNDVRQMLTNDGNRFLLTASQIVSEERHTRLGVSVIALIAMIVTGFLFVAVASYIVGLVGSSNNPVSGMIICTVLFASGLLLLFGFTGNLGIIAALGVAGIVCCAAALAGDASQDLKTGYLVKATPAMQQYAQIAGVVAAAFVIVPVLALLDKAYTIGSPELLAPQAGMFSEIVKKMFRREVFPWDMAALGVGIAVVLVIVDEIFRIKNVKFRLYVMPIAVGIYLPVYYGAPIAIGGILAAIVGLVAGKRKESALHMGILFCAGLVAGEAIMGILVGALMIPAGLPIQIWGEGAGVLPSLATGAALIFIVLMVFIVSMMGRKEKTS